MNIRRCAALLVAALISASLAALSPAALGAEPTSPVSWYGSVRQAFAEAKRAQKPLLVDLYADWCGWCKVMEQKVFPTAEFAGVAAQFVLLRVDVEDGGEGSELASRYSSTNLPTLLLLEASGAEIGAVEGYLPAPELVQRVAAVRAIDAQRLASYAAMVGSNDGESLRRTASDFYRRRDGERAANLFARLISVAPSSGDDAAWIRFFHADALRRAERFDEAHQAARAAATAGHSSGDAELAERLALLPFWIARDRQQCSEAAGELTSFERLHPKSVFLAGARHALAELRSERASCS